MHRDRLSRGPETTWRIKSLFRQAGTWQVGVVFSRLIGRTAAGLTELALTGGAWSLELDPDQPPFRVKGPAPVPCSWPRSSAPFLAAAAGGPRPGRSGCPVIMPDTSMHCSRSQLSAASSVRAAAASISTCQRPQFDRQFEDVQPFVVRKQSRDRLIDDRDQIGARDDQQEPRGSAEWSGRYFVAVRPPLSNSSTWLAGSPRGEMREMRQRGEFIGRSLRLAQRRVVAPRDADVANSENRNPHDARDRPG